MYKSIANFLILEKYVAKVKSCSIIGLSVYEIDVEVDAAGGLPAWDIVGLPDTTVKESKAD